MDTPSLDLIAAVLGLGESSRLFVELREKRALTYDFESVNVSGLDYGYFFINCAIKDRAINQAQSIILGELQKLKTHPVTKSELDKSKKLALGSIFRQIDSSQALPRLLAYEEIHFESENALADYTDKISSVSQQGITETANKYFQDKNYATAILTPKK